jgi:threonine/homoserine/homoserine lactone efflux protein
MIAILRNIALGISLAAPLGPAGVAVIQNGLRYGFSRAFLTGLGVTLADAVFLLIVFLGLSPILQWTWVRIGIWCIGAGVLLFLGFRSLRGSRASIDFEVDAPAPARNPLLVGFLVNASNPISVVWWAGVFGALLNETVGTVPRNQALLSSATILIGILGWHSIMALLTHWGRRFLSERAMRIIDLLAGLALIIFGLRFLYQAWIALWA